MSSEKASTRGSRFDAALQAEASAWLARLHGPNRNPHVEDGFRAWLNESPAHAAAFEHMTDTWEKAARLQRRPIEQLASWELPGIRVSFSRAAVAALVVALFAAMGTVFYLRNDGLTTDVGEQRILTLDDGSRVYLNTATRARVNYDKSARRVELERGEALFDVARNPRWPFIVVAGDRQIEAIGTSFIVRREKQDLAVTLVEGKVSVSRVNAEPEGSDSARHGASANESVTLMPGQRVIFNGRQAPRTDRPELDVMTAWQRGQVAMDDLPLAAAVEEMNRYSRTQLVIDSPRVAQIRISGTFRTGDSANFAAAVARTYDLDVVTDSERIVLTDR